MPHLFLVAIALSVTGAAPDSATRALLDTAAAGMGGMQTLRAIQRVRVESITEWQRLAMDDRQHPTVSSYERSTEWRDYGVPAWRYTRNFANGTGWQTVVDLVVDSVAAFHFGGKWAPQNVAYVDERNEWFALNPDRVVVAAWSAVDARTLADTTIGSRRLRRVRATINGAAATLHIGVTDGLLTLVTLRAAQPRDFGLAPWGVMDVAVWYSRWQRVSAMPALTIPTQLDIFRAGHAYKRVTALGVQVNPDIPADTLAMPDSLRRAFMATGNKPMFDSPVDSAKIVDDHFAVFGTFGTPAGAVKVGGVWLMLDAGVAPLMIERSAAFLARADPGTPLIGAILDQQNAQGGLAWLAQRKLKAWVTPGAKGYADATRRGWSLPAGAITHVQPGTWIRVGTDSVRVETLDLPDAPRAGIVFVPSLRWAFASMAIGPVALERVQALVRARHWDVARVGVPRNVVGDLMPR